MDKNSFTNRKTNSNTKTIIAKNADFKLKTYILTDNCIYKYEDRKWKKILKNRFSKFADFADFCILRIFGFFRF